MHRLDVQPQGSSSCQGAATTSRVLLRHCWARCNRCGCAPARETGHTTTTSTHIASSEVHNHMALSPHLWGQQRIRSKSTCTTCRTICSTARPGNQLIIGFGSQTHTDTHIGLVASGNRVLAASMQGAGLATPSAVPASLAPHGAVAAHSLQPCSHPAPRRANISCNCHCGFVNGCLLQSSLFAAVLGFH